MSGLWRRVALAAALSVTLAAVAADAQTVVVKNAPAGTPIELRWNVQPVASATAGADGLATVAFGSNQLGRPETDARVLVDVCDTTRRITLVERALQPPAPDPGCARTEVGQFVLLRPTTSLLVDLAPAAPTLWVRQGPVPPTWLLNVEVAPIDRPRRPAPKGIILFGDGGFTEFGRFKASACGTSNCDAKTFRRGFGVGAAIWPSQYFGLEGGYHKTVNATASGDENTYSYDSTLDAQVITASALVGIPVGRVRFYGRGGATHHRASTSTTQRIEPRTITIGGVSQTIPGGTQEYELRTAGWGWIFGAGLEGWLSRSFALYGEGNYGALKGGARDDGEGELDERITALSFGIRIRLGG